METKEIVLAHQGDGTVWFRTNELHKDQRPLLSFTEEGNPSEKFRSLLSRALRVDPVVMNIYRSGFFQNGCVSLLGTIGLHRVSTDGADFCTTIQVDGDIVCKIDRLVLSEPYLAERLEGFARIQTLFVEELQQVTAQFKNRVLGSGLVGSIGGALTFYFKVLRQLFA